MKQNNIKILSQRQRKVDISVFSHDMLFTGISHKMSKISLNYILIISKSSLEGAGSKVLK